MTLRLGQRAYYGPHPWNHQQHTTIPMTGSSPRRQISTRCLSSKWIFWQPALTYLHARTRSLFGTSLFNQGFAQLTLLEAFSLASPPLQWASRSGWCVALFLPYGKDRGYLLSLQARWLGSVHHTIHRETAAYSVVHIALIPLTVIPAYLKAFATHPERFSHSILPFEPMVANIIEHKEKPTIQPQSTARVSDGKSSAVERPVRFGSETDRHGNARLGLTEVPEWNAYEHESEVLHGKFEALYQQFLEEEKLEKVGGVESFNGEALNGRA